MSKRTALIIAMMAAVPATSLAAEGLYVGANLSQVKYKETGFDDVNPTAISVHIGKSINKNFAIEGRLGVGLSSDNIDILGNDVEIEVDNLVGVYMKGVAPISDTFAIYGLLGFTSGKMSISAPTIPYSATESDSDISLGVGAQFNANEKTNIAVEWARLFEGTNYEVSSLSVGLSVGF